MSILRAAGGIDTVSYAKLHGVLCYGQPGDWLAWRLGIGPTRSSGISNLIGTDGRDFPDRQLLGETCSTEGGATTWLDGGAGDDTLIGDRGGLTR